MPSESIEQSIQDLILEASVAVHRLDWAKVTSIADAVLQLDPENSDAQTFKSLASDRTGTVSGTESLEQEIQEARKVRSADSSGTTGRQRSRFLSKKKLVVVTLTIIVGVFLLNIQSDESKYRESIETDRVRLETARHDASESWDDFWDDYAGSLKSLFLESKVEADEAKAVAALAVLATFERRSSNFIGTLNSKSPPAGCAEYHSLILELAQLGRDLATAQINFIHAIDNGSSAIGSARQEMDIVDSQIDSLGAETSSFTNTCG